MQAPELIIQLRQLLAALESDEPPRLCIGLVITSPDTEQSVAARSWSPEGLPSLMHAYSFLGLVTELEHEVIQDVKHFSRNMAERIASESEET